MERTQRERMLAGELYMASDPELSRDHLNAQELLARFNASGATDEVERTSLLEQLFGYFGEAAVVKPTLRCDYGYKHFNRSTDIRQLRLHISRLQHHHHW